MSDVGILVSSSQQLPRRNTFPFLVPHDPVAVIIESLRHRSVILSLHFVRWMIRSLCQADLREHSRPWVGPCEFIALVSTPLQ